MPAAKKTARAPKPEATPADTYELATDPFAFAKRAQDELDAFTATMGKSFGAQTGDVQDRAMEVFEAARDGMEAVQARVQSVGAEAADAARAEIADAVDFANELARAKTIADALEIQHDYWTRLFDERLERARGLARHSLDAARDALDPATKSMATAMSAAGAYAALFPQPGK